MATTINLPLLDRIAVASPCHARWEDMVGDERVRHCAECNLNVHNLSAMTRDETEGVLAGLAQGRVCARFYRRADGTILVQDCPVGLAKIRARARRALVRLAAVIGLVGGAGIAAGTTGRTWWGERIRLRALKPYSTVCEWIAPSAPAAVPPQPAVMGDMIYLPAARPSVNPPTATGPTTTQPHPGTHPEPGHE